VRFAAGMPGLFQRRTGSFRSRCANPVAKVNQDFRIGNLETECCSCSPCTYRRGRGQIITTELDGFLETAVELIKC